MKSHILTITLNPTVDFCTTSPHIVPGPKLRCTDPQIDPGGGGINVARAVKLLGGQATALVAIGTPRYGQQSLGSAKNWTLREWTGALAPDRPMRRAVYLLDTTRGDLVANADCVLRDAEPARAAQALKDWLRSLYCHSVLEP